MSKSVFQLILVFSLKCFFLIFSTPVIHSICFNFFIDPEAKIFTIFQFLQLINHRVNKSFFFFLLFGVELPAEMSIL